MNVDNAKEAFSHAKEVFYEELNRMSQIDNKANSLLSSQTIAISIAALFADDYNKLYSRLPQNYQLIFKLIACTIIIVYFITCILLIYSLRLRGYLKPSIDRQIINYFLNNNLERTYIAFAKRYLHDAGFNYAQNNKKASILMWCYSLLFCNFVIISITFTIAWLAH